MHLVILRRAFCAEGSVHFAQTLFMNSSPPLSLFRSAQNYWREAAMRDGSISATTQLIKTFWDFLLDSTPERRRARFGDADYDWERRVNTTSGAVGWRDRLLGAFHSPYQPTEPTLFQEMIEGLRERASSDFQNFTFIDLGSGKGRTLLMASDYPFHRILGVELLPSLDAIAKENIASYRNESQQCFSIESICADATEFTFPCDPLVLFLFNPLPESGLARVISNLEQSLRTNPRPVYVLYHNPLLEHVVQNSSAFQKLFSTHQYAIYSSTPEK
jgi:SAM-dependent methyltransferase